MKKEIFIIAVLFLGLSLETLAATGSAYDGLEFLMVIFGVLLIILGLLHGIDFLKKNGKTMINKAISFFKNKSALLRNYLHKLKTDLLDLSYF